MPDEERTIRIMVDMSVTLIHQNHISKLKQAKALGTVILALTIDLV